MRIFFTCIIVFINICTSYSQRIQLRQTTTIIENLGPSGYSSYTNPYKKFEFRNSATGTFIGVGSYGSVIRPYFEDNPEALKHLNHYRTKRSIGTVAIVGAIGSFIYFAAENFKNVGNSVPGPGAPGSPGSNDSGFVAGGWLGAAVGFAVLNFVFPSMSNKDMLKAVEAFNGGLSHQGQGSEIGVKLRILSGESFSFNTAGIGVYYKF